MSSKSPYLTTPQSLLLAEDYNKWDIENNVLNGIIVYDCSEQSPYYKKPAPSLDEPTIAPNGAPVSNQIYIDDNDLV